MKMASASDSADIGEERLRLGLLADIHITDSAQLPFSTPWEYRVWGKSAEQAEAIARKMN